MLRRCRGVEAVCRGRVEACRGRVEACRGYNTVSRLYVEVMARGAVDKARAIGARSAAYLSGLDADERPIKGVHVDDEKAMFLFRWYQEIDKNGKVLTGYQNKECKGYYLPLDNGGYGFEWVSNLQVICVVHLKPAQGKNRTFTLPAADKKTVTEAMKKMLLP